MPRPTAPMPARGRYSMTLRRPTGLCSAPTQAIHHATTGHESVDLTHAAELRGELPEDNGNPTIGQICGRTPVRFFRDPIETTPAPTPATCHGTEWPPVTSWQRYAQDRASGQRIPPSASTWRHEDAMRQAAAEREARASAVPVPAAVAWGPGPACDDRRAVG